MVKHRLQVSHDQDSIQLFWQRCQTMPRSAPPIQFSHPFDATALAELRWYLEDYLMKLREKLLSMKNSSEENI